MSGFLYFIDGYVNPITEQQITEFGLEYAFERKPMHGPLHGHTPSGGSGTILADEKRLAGKDLVYRASEQVWRKRPGSQNVYIGWWKDAPPTPGDLVRAATIDGDAIELTGRAKWVVPRLKFWADEGGYVVCLPSSAGLDDDGNWVLAEVDAKFSPLNQLADRLYAAIVLAPLGKADPLTTEEALDAAATLLGVNYVVSKPELGFIRALPLEADIPRLKAVCMAAIDHERASEWAQKKTLEASQAVETGSHT